MRFFVKTALLIAIIASVAFAASSPPAKKPAPKSPAGKLAKAPAKPPKKPAAKPLPKLVDFGAGWCTPCKMMKPVLEGLEKDYKGKLQVVYVDINKDEAAASKQNIRVIPTQIFYDVKGKEFNRHEGFMSRQDILAQFKARGYDLDKKK